MNHKSLEINNIFWYNTLHSYGKSTTLPPFCTEAAQSEHGPWHLSPTIETLKDGLIIFRRSDVQHRNWHCRVKLPKADRYKTFSLETADIIIAREKAFDHDGDIQFRLKHDVPVFHRPFRDVATEYLAKQLARSKRGEISAARPKKTQSCA